MTDSARLAFFHYRRHGASVEAAAKRAGITTDQAHRLEGRTYCPDCGDYVRDIDCAHWDALYL